MEHVITLQISFLGFQLFSYTNETQHLWGSRCPRHSTMTSDCCMRSSIFGRIRGGGGGGHPSLMMISNQKLFMAAGSYNGKRINFRLEITNVTVPQPSPSEQL